MGEEGFYSLWNRYDNFGLPEEPPTICIFAQMFSEWATDLCTQVTNNPGIVAINQAKVLLVDKYFEWRSYVPKSHRNRMGKVGHECIFQVFEKTYIALKRVELRLTPPRLSEQPAPLPPPPPPPPPQIAAIVIGELDKS